MPCRVVDWQQCKLYAESSNRLSRMELQSGVGWLLVAVGLPVGCSCCCGGAAEIQLGYDSSINNVIMQGYVVFIIVDSCAAVCKP